jgi:beta-glucosidase-like glycosyl hydrolase/CubicO group peptidase (beta-lactamase class C family)
MTGHHKAHLRPLLRVVAGVLVLLAALAAMTGGRLSEVGGIPEAAAAETDLLPIDPRIALPAEAAAWVADHLASMSLEEKAGQVLMVRAFGEYYPEDAEQRRELVGLVEDLALGGVILFRSQAYAGAALLHDLQSAAAAAGHLPLIVAADFEWGADFRIDGAVPFPTAMAVGATFDAAAAEWMGRASASDARALGIHWIFAPVADVNVNPRNPVINVRAFGEAPDHVAGMVAAFVRGAQAAGVLATAKHFPGHGDTSVDSHLALPVLSHDSQRLQQVELAPFRAAIDAGVASVMTAHLAVPALTADQGLPATLSPAILTDLLRQQLAFEGLIVTDAMEMGGISRRWWSGQAAVEALAAGADMVLLSPNPRAVHAAVVGAVRRGDLEESRLNDAVRKVLAAKARLGITEKSRALPLEGLPQRFAPASEIAAAQRVSDAAITLLRDRSELLPLDARRWNDVVVVGISDSDTPAPTGAFTAALREPLANVRSFSIDGRTRGDEAAAIVAAAARARTLVLAVRVRLRTSSGTIELPERQARYAKMLADLEAPTIVVALGSPYAAAAFPRASTVLAAYGWSDPLQRAAARAMVGASSISGKLPVSVPGLYPVGHGEAREPLDARLVRADPGAVDLSDARAALRAAVDDGAFPGATYAIGHRGRIIGSGAVGRMSSAPDASPMPDDALFDLASLTKVVATLPVAMLAIERGALRLDYPVQALVPEFAGRGRGDVTIRHLLTHSSGLPAYVEFFSDFEPAGAGDTARRRVLERIYQTDLTSPPGTRYVYSDLGIILLGEVLTRAFGEPYDAVARREIFGPLGMSDTDWNPSASELGRIPPTENDGWRGRVVHGEVHDRNAFVMGGVSSHAGLFSTANDLAIYAQMMLNLGTYDHTRVLRRSTADSWRRRQNVVAGSSRGLGWDTAFGSDRWGMLSATAFGHTGFTGTSLWIDPPRELFVVLLSNRVNPTRDNTGHVQARVDFHAAVVAAIDRAR